MRKRSSEEGSYFPLATSSPSYSERAPSASSDSGLSVASQGRTGARRRRGPGQDECGQAGKLVPGVDFEIAQPLLEVMTELAALGADGGMVGEESALGHTLNGEASSSERETDILDDEDDVAAPALEMPSSGRFGSLSSENVCETQSSAQTEYSTQSWVRQQQVVGVTPDDHAAGGEGWPNRRKARPPPLVAPVTPPRGVSSREAVQRGLGSDDAHSAAQNTSEEGCGEDELASLTTDIDESIEQLNQLILDLDPTFVPVPTRCSPLSRSASLHTNGLSLKGSTYLTGKTDQNALIAAVSIAECDLLACIYL